MKRTVVYLTRVYHFNAGHRLFHPERDAAWNQRIYGKCSNPGGHGHNYRLEVTIRGTPDPDTGWISSISSIDSVVADTVLEPMDHRNLNEVLELDHGPCPTTEVLILEIWERLCGAIPGPASLHRLRISETRKNEFEIEAP